MGTLQVYVGLPMDSRSILSWLRLESFVMDAETFEAIFVLKSRLKYKEALIANPNFTIVNNLMQLPI